MTTNPTRDAQRTSMARQYSEDHNENLAFRTGFAEGLVAGSQKNLLIDVAAFLAPFVEDGKPIARSEARDLLARVRNDLKNADGAPTSPQLDEAARRANTGAAA